MIVLFHDRVDVLSYHSEPVEVFTEIVSYS